MFKPIEPTPPILFAAGAFRDATPINPNPGVETNRAIATPDAIHLMTCVHARDVLGIHDIVFQTFDRGRNPVAGEKGVPIIGFERYFPEGSRTSEVEKVCQLTRAIPKYPEQDLVSGGDDD